MKSVSFGIVFTCLPCLFGQCICVGLVSLRCVFFSFFWPGDVKTFAKSALNWFAGRRSNWFYTRIASHRNGLNRSRAERTCISEIHPLHSQWPKEMAIEVGLLSCRLHTPEVWWTRWFWQFGGANWFHFAE